jgi:hypothetical protein
MFEQRPYWEKPCADRGLISYRYNGPFGYVMIGAKDDDDAYRQASRSIEQLPDRQLLQVWRNDQYVNVAQA